MERKGEEPSVRSAFGLRNQPFLPDVIGWLALQCGSIRGGKSTGKARNFVSLYSKTF